VSSTAQDNKYEKAWKLLKKWTIVFKVLMKRIFYYLILKSFQNVKEWRFFYCDTTLDSRFIQDLDLCKLDDF